MAEASTLQICETVSTLNKRVVFSWLSRCLACDNHPSGLALSPTRFPETTMLRRGDMFEPSVSGA